MQIPATWMTRHLMWTRSGVVWATWRLQAPLVNDLPVVYPFATKDTQKWVHLHHQALFQSLRGEALLLGLTADLDPTVVAEKMLANVDLSVCPEWADEVELQLDELEQIPVGERAYWLSVPLGASSLRERISQAFSASVTQVNDMLGRARQAPAPSEVQRMMELAREVEKQIPSPFRASRATAAEQVWIAAHCATRGLGGDTAAPVPDPMPRVSGSMISAPTAPSSHSAPWTLGRAMPSVWFDEGSQSTASRVGRWFPQRRRHLEVQADAWAESSYQVLLGLAAGPRDGWLSPGSEWASFVDRLPMNVDFCQRIQVTSAAEAQRQNMRAEQNLADQFNQQESKSGTITGGTGDLEEIARQLATYHAKLNSTENEVAVRGAMIFAVGGATAEDAHRMAQNLVEEYGQFEFTLKAEAGEQENMWWAFLPGAPTEKIVRDLQHPTTGREWASGIPLVDFELGESTGWRFGVNISSGRHSLVFRDPDDIIVKNSSPSYGIVGEKGGGKSVTLKDEMGNIVDRGGRVLSVDRTDTREYADMARTLNPDETSLVDLTRPECSLDPLRAFGPVVGAAMVQSLFTTMLHVDPFEEMGETLSSVLDKDELRKKNVTSLADLQQHLQEHSSPETDRLLRRMRVVSSKSYGQVLFDDSLPPMDPKARAIVFLTAGMPIPTKTELETPQLFKTMDAEKHVSRALHAMIMKMIREICFQDRTELAAAIIDECYSVTQSPEGENDVKLFLRDDRKHRALIAMGAQDVEPLGSPSTRAMFKNRFVTRQTSEDLAFESVKWATGVKNDEDVEQRYVDAVMELSPLGSDGNVLPGREGEMLMRDTKKRIGLVKKSLPARPWRAEGLLSTPPAKAVT